jgi:uncharacterized protein YegL
MDSILFSDSNGNFKCYYNHAYQPATITDGVTAVAGFNSGSNAGCPDCLDYCPPQDIVILIDQSSSVGGSNFATLRNGVVEIANELENLMDDGIIQLSAYKWSDCDSVELISNLTSSHTSFVNAVNAATYGGGGTYGSQALDTAYDELSGMFSNSSASKTIILLTDGGLADYSTDTCGVGYSAVQAAFFMKLGVYGSLDSIKIITVNISNGSQGQLLSIASGEDNYFSATTFNDWETTVAQAVADVSCDENPYEGAEYRFYEAENCCTVNGGAFLPNIYVAVEVSTTINTGDGFNYNENCYEFTGGPNNSFSANSLTIIDQSSIVSNICNSCDCTSYKVGIFRECCYYTDGYTNLPDLYLGINTDDGWIPGPTNNAIQYSGRCLTFIGYSTTELPIDYITNFDESCEKIRPVCPQCPQPSPSVTPSISITPTITPTKSVTPTVTPSITPSVTPPNLLASEFTACTPFSDNVLVPYDGGTIVYEYNGINYDVPLEVNSVCDLQTLMNTATTVATATSIRAASLYHYSTNQYADAPWLLSEGGGSSTAAYIYWNANNTNITLSAETCQLPDVLYMTGATGIKEGVVYSVSLTDGSTQCMVHTQNLQSTQPFYVDSVITEYSSCDTCLSACNRQDIMILMDQSGSIEAPDWELLKDGIIQIADDLESRMDFGS